MASFAAQCVVHRRADRGFAACGSRTEIEIRPQFDWSDCSVERVELHVEIFRQRAKVRQ